ncbi:Asp23/Gls24 family envelope stress response protein [Streptomyces sp. CHD11]|uniref:Asp23/Gls24 family envelope stress response protein n=1 Tax=Streptomyces sp. CHD11 TaxID=2741325 RepID=UPI001BFCC0B7|nr:Asp23/Gls24 family envelope stress response protein [Streptomyces sp. CHD11]MBT3150607.1 Asp23/Gls24 family envelope stress response protein [Streptomyces sp. CHD11]
MTAVSTGTVGLGGSPRAVAAGERGETRIADRVVAKIASQAAREAVGTLPPDAAPPHAHVAVRHDAARIRVHIELDYPGDIGGRCRRVRRHVVDRVRTLTGMAVPEVAVQVERLHPLAGSGTEHGRTR